MLGGVGFVRGGRGDGPLLRVAHGEGGQVGFELEPLEVGMFCLFRNSHASPGMLSSALPVRLGRVLRIASEVQSSPFVVVEYFWPVLKPDKYGDKLNLFGTWVRSAEPTVDKPVPARKKIARSVPEHIMVNMPDVLVWPVDLEEPSKKHPNGGRIPFAALLRLRTAHDIDLATPAFTFARRGKAFYFEVVKQAARRMHELYEP